MLRRSLGQRLSAGLLACAILLTALCPRPASAAQETVTIHSGKGIFIAPDGYYRLNTVEGVLNMNSIVIDFQKKGSVIEGGGYNVGVGFSGVTRFDTLFCFKGNLLNGEISLTRSILVRPEFVTYLPEVRVLRPDDKWLLRKLTQAELEPNTMATSNYVACQPYNDLYDPFESLLEESDRLTPYIEGAGTVVHGAKNVTGNARVTLQWYKNQIKKATEEVLEDLHAGRLSPAEARLKAAALRSGLAQGSLAQSNALSRGILELLEKDKTKTLADVRNRLALQKYRREYRTLSLLQKTKVTRELVLQAAKAVYVAEVAQAGLKTAGKLLKMFDVGLMIAHWIVSENLFADVVQDLIKLAVANQGRLFGIAASAEVCVFTGLAAVVCGAVLILAGSIAGELAAQEGIDFVKEWFSKASGLFDEFVFWDEDAEPLPDAPALARSRGSEEESEEEPKSGGQSFDFELESRALTKIYVTKGMRVRVTASGSIILGLMAGAATPTGVQGFTEYNLVSGARHGALLVRVRQTGDEDWLIAGTRSDFLADRPGYLEFLVNDAEASNNIGSFKIQVTLGP